MEDNIRLRWTSHQGTILSVFDALLSTESLVDVTLACEGQYIRAHKVILSACSPYFQDLINLDLNKHPIFFLKDVKFTEIKALVQYMYRGEVNIDQEELRSLLSVAQALKIRGLADVETTNSCTADTVIPDVDANRITCQPPLPCVAVSPPQSATSSVSSKNGQTGANIADITTFLPPSSMVAPPAAKRARVVMRKSVRVKKQAKLSYPLATSTVYSTTGPGTTQAVVSLQPTVSNSGITISSSHQQSPALVKDVEDAEAYEVEWLKVEGAANASGDYQGDGHNWMNGPSLSESWNDDPDNSRVVDGEFAGGSGVNGHPTVGSEDREGIVSFGVSTRGRSIVFYGKKKFNLHRNGRVVGDYQNWRCCNNPKPTIKCNARLRTIGDKLVSFTPHVHNCPVFKKEKQ